MTKAKISEYDAVASNNTDVNGVNIAEGCPPSGMNNMGREIMAALKRFQVGSDGDGVTVGGNLVVSGSSTVNTFTAGPVSATTLNTSGAVVFNDAGADVDFRVEGDTVANLLFVDASTDRVGIGTNAPGAKLDVLGATADQLRLRTAATEEYRIGRNASTGLLNFYGSQAGFTGYVFGGVDGDRVTIDSSGNLLVGTTSLLSGGERVAIQSTSADWTTVLRNTNASAPYGILVQYTGASPNSTSREFLYCSDSTALRASIRSNGGLANYSANNVNLSDARVKKDIENLGSQWNCLKEWNLVEFRYNEQADDAPKNYGVIAQQIQEHCPEVVQVFQEAKDAVEAREAVLDEDGNVVEPAVEAQPAQEERIGVREQQMVWMSIKALQEAMERIETLEAKVAALENA